MRTFQVFRCVAQLIPVLATRITGATHSGAFGSDAAIDNVVRYVRGLSGVTIDPGGR
jgi:hypothetical protein